MFLQVLVLVCATKQNLGDWWRVHTSVMSSSEIAREIERGWDDCGSTFITVILHTPTWSLFLNYISRHAWSFCDCPNCCQHALPCGILVAFSWAQMRKAMANRESWKAPLYSHSFSKLDEIFSTCRLLCDLASHTLFNIPPVEMRRCVFLSKGLLFPPCYF